VAIGIECAVAVADKSIAKKMEIHKEKLARGVEEKSKKMQATLKETFKE
jgi:hypothetical protein